MIKKTFIFYLILFSSGNQLLNAQNSYIRDWLICGSFKIEAVHESLTYPYIEKEHELVPFGGAISNGRIWMLYHSPADKINLLIPTLNFPYTEQCVAYLHAYIYSPRRQGARILVGSDDEVALWLNGQRIHSNAVQRGHQFDDDSVSCKFESGWNRLLVKVTNGAVDWAFSARIIDATGLKIQAVSPFTIPVEEQKLPTVKLLQGPGKPQMVIDKNGEPLCKILYSFLNQATQPIHKLKVSLLRNQKILSPVNELKHALGGEIFEYELVLSISMLDSILLANEPTQLIVERSDGEIVCKTGLFDNRDLLQAFFSHWELQDWEERIEERVKIFERQWRVPEILRAFECYFVADIAKFWGRCLVNNRTKLPRFSGDSGDIVLTKKASHGQRFHIRIELEIDSTSNEPIQMKSGIKPGLPAIETYLFDSIYANKLFEQDMGNLDSLDHLLLQAVWEHKLNNIGKLLKQSNERIEKITATADQYTLHLIGNAHIDMAWLWPYSETIDECKRTFRAAIENMKQYPDFKFSHGQALSYYWVEQEEPELFKEIEKYVKKAQWEIVGGTWVEPDANIPDGESHVRQYLYGKRYFKEKFNVDVKTGWMPDTFGHPATLPQILAKCGIKTYTFFRPWENERYFYWQAPDRSRVLAHRPPRWYGSTAVDENLYKGIFEEEKKFKLKDFTRFYGVGDHGGGPTRRNIETILRLDESKAYPQVVMSGLGEYYEKILDKNLIPDDSLLSFPTVEGEQNFVFRGCWTSQAKTKWNNRRSESLLPMAEAFCTLAASFGYPYPDSELGFAWENVLFNQFHDILAGSSIGQVYIDAQKVYDTVFRTVDHCIDNSLRAIAANIDTNYPLSEVLPIIVFNSLNWSRSGPVEVVVKTEPGYQNIQLLDLKQNEISAQIVEHQHSSIRFIFIAPDVPALGYKTFWLKLLEAAPVKNEFSNQFILENEFLRIEFDQKSGTIKKLYDKRLRQELIEKNGSQIQIQADEPGNMSAWKLGLKGPVIKLDRANIVKITEDGPVRKVIMAKYHYNDSNFIQRFICYYDLPRLDIQVTVDWHERNKMVKIAFPLKIKDAHANFEIPFGHIERPTNGAEVPMQKWLDLSNSRFGVGIVNDCKYAADVKGSTIRLSVLRSPTYPDPKADEGFHNFSFSIIPHSGDWRTGEMARRGMDFNTQLIPIFSETHKGSQPAIHSFFKIDAKNVILSALKKVEDSDNWIIRLYEIYGMKSSVKLTFPRILKAVYESDMMEWNFNQIRHYEKTLDFVINPYEIKTLSVEFYH